MGYSRQELKAKSFNNLKIIAKNMEIQTQIKNKWRLIDLILKKQNYPNIKVN